MEKKDIDKRRNREEILRWRDDVLHRLRGAIGAFNRAALFVSIAGSVIVLLSMSAYFDAHGVNSGMQWLVGADGLISSIGLLSLISLLAFVGSVFMGFFVMNMYRETLKLDNCEPNASMMTRVFKSAWCDLGVVVFMFGWLLAGLLSSLVPDPWFALIGLAVLVSLIRIRGRIDNQDLTQLIIDTLFSSMLYALWLMFGMVWFLAFVLNMFDFLGAETSAATWYSLLLIGALLGIFLVFTVQRFRYVAVMTISVGVLALVVIVLPPGESMGTVLRVWGLGGYPAYVQTCGATECEKAGLAAGDTVYVLLPINGTLLLNRPNETEGKLVAVPLGEIELLPLSHKKE